MGIADSRLLFQDADEPGTAENYQDMVSFCPSDLTAPNKSHRPPLVIPSVPGFPTSQLYQRQRMRLSVKESRMKSTEATVFDRKSGGAEGPAVRPGSRTKVSVPLVLPQNRE
jgi:hypothetical protein